MKLNDMGLLRAGSYIDGQWRLEGAGVLTVTNPATGAVVADVATADGAMTSEAINAAHREIGRAHV